MESAAPLTPSTAAAELLARRKVRANLVEWAKVVMSSEDKVPARHHILILEKLQAIVEGKTTKRKLMIFMPPGSAKSTYASIIFPPWFLAQSEGLNILACSHNKTLVDKFGKHCRNLITEYGPTLGYGLMADSQAKDDWATDKRGAYLGAGVGAGISGFRADLGLIDDPIGKKEDADSKNEREKQHDWYEWDFKKRLKPGAIVVLIQTRWHEDDLAGWLLTREPNEWEVLCLPLIAEENDPLGRKIGEPLWVEYFDKDLLASRQKSPGFTAQEQQRPAPVEGSFFKKEMLQGYELRDLPPLTNLRMYLASDHATGEGDENCNSAILVGGMDSNGYLYILPQLYWDRGDALTQTQKGLALAHEFNVAWWFIEYENIAKTIGPFMRRLMREEGKFVSTLGLKPTRDKLKRAQSIHARMSQKMVLFPKFATWWPKAEHELLTFPNGTLWDFVSALGLFGLGLNEIITGDAPVKQEAEELNTPFKPTLKWLKEDGRQQRLATDLALMDN